MKLEDRLEESFRLNDLQKKGLKKLGLFSISDLLGYFPARYGNTGEIHSISNLIPGERAVVFGKIKNLDTMKAFKKKIPMAKGIVEDTTGSIEVVWFNQPYIAKIIREGSLVKIDGVVSEKNGKLHISNPAIEEVPKISISSKESLFGEDGPELTMYPVYPETRGVTSLWIYHSIQKIFKSGILEQIIDPIPENILKKYSLPSLKSALVWIHAPQNENDQTAARKRFAFQEIFFIQISKMQERKRGEKNEAYKIDPDPEEIKKFISRFPFPLTSAQEKALGDIFSDLKKGRPMSRLLEGDVGSGKTAVAASAVYAATITEPKGQNYGTLQSAYMAPTEILARQHFYSFIKYFSHLPINIALITGSGCEKFPSKLYADRMRTRRGQNAEGILPWTSIPRSQLLKWVASGEISILIGTHALIQKSVKFKNLGLVIIDEQHRFGTSQRQALARRKDAEQTQNDAEKIDPLLYKDLTYRIRDVLFRVKKELGSGHKEIIYQKALAEELKVSNLKFSQEVRIPIKYKTKEVGIYIPDFVVENKIIVELKALPFIGANEKKQIWSYLKGSEYRLALLVNFGPKELTVNRIIYDIARTSASVPRSSASIPHLLSMTATPIPRTLALTLYGDLDLTLLDEMPAGRKKVETEIVLPNEREIIYEKIKKELEAGRQAYVICPRINEPDPDKEKAVNAKSVKEEAKRLKKDVFKKYSIGIMHSKMKPAEKESVMKDFEDHKIDILVSTSVVEVGVNVPNATVIIIEGAERFGLSQLHQFRGRVIRSNHQAYCYVFAQTKSDKTIDRLKALKTAKNGFELSEMDLKLRGAGELYGNKQWGLTDIAMDALKNIKMVEAARNEAEAIIKSDLELTSYPLLKKKIETKKEIHFE